MNSSQLGLFFAGTAIANPTLINLPEDTWFEAPNTHMQSVCPPRAEFSYLQGSGGCRMVIAAWGGGAYDPSHHRMYVWGGGHNDYFGNELYAFDVDRLAWDLIAPPSPPPVVDQDPLPGGAPVSRHTYDGLAFLASGPDTCFFAHGGSMAGGAGSRTHVTWCFDLRKNAWRELPVSGTLPFRHLTSAADPSRGVLYMRDHSNVFSFTLATGRWETLLAWEHGYGEQRSSFDPVRGIFFTLGNGEFLAYGAGNNRDISAQWQGPGGDSVIAGYAPGMDYDWKADCLVAWMGGGPWIFDLKLKQWTRGNATGAPPRQTANGTYGRWRYIPEYNVFLLVNEYDQNVRFYKHKRGGGVELALKLRRPRISSAHRTRRPAGFDLLARKAPERKAGQSPHANPRAPVRFHLPERGAR